MPTFVHLHLHSDTSLRDGAQTIKQIVSKTKRLNMPAVALTDHGVAGGLLQLKKECQKEGIKWIGGQEFFISPGDHKLKEKVEGFKPYYHLTVLAKNYEGLKNIFRLSSIGWLEGFYHRPRISLELLTQYAEGLIVLSGCGASLFSKYIVEDKFQEAINHAKFLKEVFRDDFYIELQNHGLDWQLPLKAGSIAIADKLNIECVITQDAHYQEREDSELHKHICKLSSGDLEFGTDQNYFKSRAEMEEMFPENEYKYLDATLEIADKVNIEWDHSKTIWPVYPLPEGRSAEQELRDLTYKGFNKLFPNPTQEYKDRIEEELEVIISVGFSSYFLIVQDFINWSRNQGMAMSCGRGSSAGSLCCYCLGITEIDPIKYNLLFSRFLDPVRALAGGLCDIDVDIQKDRRQEVIQYVSEKYGQDKICQIGTYGVFKPRGSLRAFARTCGYDVSVGNKLAAMVPADIAGKQLKFSAVLEAEPKFLQVEEQDVVTLAKKAEGIKNQAGVHAAGVVIADRPINELLPLFLGKHNEVASQFDMHDVEDIGLVKFDFLGLKNLTVIANTLRLIKQNHNIDINLREIEDKDKKAYQLFKSGDLHGIFQFETSSGLRELCTQTQPNNIEDLSALNALFRPGPIGQNMLQEYVDRRNGKKFEYDIPQLEPILKETYGVIVLQEQIMRICTDIAGYSKPDSASFRKIVGKKLPEQMIKEHDRFIAGCIERSNIPKTKAEKLFKDIEDFALYGFCAAHSIAYSFISYRTSWLKAHYQKEFYTALLNTSENPDDLVKYTYSAREHGITLIAPDINKSDSKFKLDNGTIVFGLSGISGLGEKGCEKLIAARPEEGFRELSDLVKAKINRNIIVALAECGALESISDLSRNQIVEHIPELIEYYKKLDNWEEQRQKRVIRDKEIQEAVSKGEKPPRKLPKLKDKPILKEVGEYKSISKEERLELERKTLGIYLTGHPLDNYSHILKVSKYTIDDIKQGSTQDREIVRLPVVISSFEKKFSKSKKNYGIAILEDLSGRIDATIFSKAWEKVSTKLKEGIVVMAICRVNKQSQDDGPTVARLSISDIEPLLSQNNTEDIVIKLKDNSVIRFIYDESRDISNWNNAQTIAKRMVI